MSRRPRIALLALALAASGCAAGNPYRAEPIDPEVAEAVETSPQTVLRANVQGGLLLVELERTSRKHWKERAVFRERATSYDAGADVAEFLFFPIALAGYVALSPVLVPLDASGRFTSYVGDYPDRRPWAMIESLAVGFVPGVTTHFYDESLEVGQPTLQYVRGEWQAQEKWVTRPIGGARIEVLAPDGTTLGDVVTDPGGRGALYLRNLREALRGWFDQAPVVRLRVMFGGAVQEVSLRPEDLG